MQRLRQWLIDSEHTVNMPLVFQHCDFVEIVEHINRQQVIDIDSMSLPSVQLLHIVTFCATRLTDDKVCCKT